MSNLGNAYLDEIKWFIECFIDDSYEQSEDKETLLKMTEEDLKDIVYKMLDDSELNECLNSTIRYYLFHYKKLEHKKEEYKQLLNGFLGNFKDSISR